MDNMRDRLTFCRPLTHNGLRFYVFHLSCYMMKIEMRSDYHVETSHFEGPLALLLRLIEQNELDITKIALAKVTDQFLQHVDEMKQDPDIETVADFLVVAARLLWIKSRVLLPQRKESTSERDEEDIGDELIRQLRTYRRYKEAAQWLRERHNARLHAHVRVAPLPRPRKTTLDLAGLTVEKLHALAQEVIYPTDKPRPEDAIQRPRISITQQIQLIRLRLSRRREISFQTLLGRRPTRLEAVVTLQAILELMKQRIVWARQKERFGGISIKALVPPDQILASAATENTPPVSPPTHQ